jgi:hypothetical protein
MKKLILSTIFFGAGLMIAGAQVDSSLFKRIPASTGQQHLNMDAVYDRPFITMGKMPVSLGGYAEVNWQHLSQDGVSEGHQFQMRRMTIFLASTIAKKIKFLSEIEFEEGGKEIAIEFAAIDVEFHPLINLRGGIVMNPIGAFNQNHDGPKWEFTDRPASATQMLPATWSNAGFGLFGKTYKGEWMFGYEIYLTGGFDDAIIDNPENKTFLPASKENPDRFEESVSGLPLVTAKIAFRYGMLGELGVSYMGGVYNNFEEDGIPLGGKRRADVFAVDFNSTVPVAGTFITGEWAWVLVDVPGTYSQQYGSRQYGGFVDLVQPVWRRSMFGWEQSVVNIACRLEYVDWNAGTFNETGDRIGDAMWSVMPAISFRPVPQTVFRLNYRYLQQRDILNNDPSVTGGFIFGISSYF